MAKTKNNISEDKVVKFDKLVCPFMSGAGAVAEMCVGDSCAVFVVHRKVIGGSVVFAGCGLKWLGVCANKMEF